MAVSSTFREGYKTPSLVLGNPALSVTATATEDAGVLAAYGAIYGIATAAFTRAWYAEFTLTTMSASKNIAVGCKTVDDSLTSKPGADTTSFGYDASTNQVRLNGGTAAATGWGAPVQGDIIGFRIVESTGAITAYLNGANPVSIGTLTAATQHLAAVYLYDSGDSVTANFGGADGMTFSALPAGSWGWDYRGWPGTNYSMIGADKTASVTISNYGRTALATASNTAVGARLDQYRTIGTGSGGGSDRYCEFTVDVKGANNIAVGLLTSGDAVASIAGNVATSVGYYTSTNLAKADNGTGAATGWTAPIAADVIGMRVNMTTRVVTFYKNGVAATSTVTLGTADSYAPHIYLYTLNDQVTFNAGGPTGFDFAYLPAGCIGWNVDMRDTKIINRTVASPRPVHHIRL